MTIKSTKTVVEYKCDRCGTKADGTKSKLPDCWVSYVLSVNPAEVYGPPYHWCDDCVDSYKIWAKGVQEETS